MPVYGTVVPVDSKEHDRLFVRRPGPDASTGISIVAAQAKVLLTWVDGQLGVMTDYYRRHYGIKIVGVAHSDWPLCCGSIQENCDHLSAVSVRAAEQAYNKSSTPVQVIYNGVDVERCVPVTGRDAFRTKYGIDKNAIVLTYVGRFSKEKNCLVAAQIARKLGKPFTALYVGGGDQMKGTSDEEWLPNVREASNDNFVFTGPLNNIGDALAASDVLINCSNNEGFCLTIVEAWLAGLPVVATPVGALPELTEKLGELVVSVPVGASTATQVDAVMRALGRSFRPIADKAKLIAWEKFTTPRMAEQWTNYIERITNV
jgi:glycosyltransferase involved in cell wall biosynthesis